jgi:hypothetical protein
MATELTSEEGPPTAGPPYVTEGASGYPLRFHVEYPERLSRWMIFVKWILAIPHFLILYALYMVVYVITIIAFFAILFTGRYPRSLFDFVVNTYRWGGNVSAYTALLRDEYPPFSWDAGQYPVTYEVDYPETLSRWLPFFKLWIPILVIPHIVVLFFVYIAALVVWVIVFFAILFTARIPEGMFNFLVGVARWSYRVTAYQFLLRDEYPPFSTNP